MKTIRLAENSPEFFLKKVQKTLCGKKLSPVARFQLVNENLTIRFAGFGESKIRYTIRKSVTDTKQSNSPKN
ncbi:hypothetical protein AB3N59_10875 [Leptospira sp. WS92.C1]